MGLAKKDSTAIGAGPLSVVASDGGTAAAVARLTDVAGTAKTTAAPHYMRPNDDARGKTRCKMFEAALQSPAIAGMQFKTMDEYLALVKEAAEAGVKYSFND